MSQDIAADEASLCDKAAVLSSAVRDVLCKFAALVLVGNQMRFLHKYVTLWHNRGSCASVM